MNDRAYALATHRALNARLGRRSCVTSSTATARATTADERGRERGREDDEDILRKVTQSEMTSGEARARWRMAWPQSEVAFDDDARTVDCFARASWENDVFTEQEKDDDDEDDDDDDDVGRTRARARRRTRTNAKEEEKGKDGDDIEGCSRMKKVKGNRTIEARGTRGRRNGQARDEASGAGKGERGEGNARTESDGSESEGDVRQRGGVKDSAMREKRKYERRGDGRNIKLADLRGYPSGMMVWCRLTTTNRGQWWPGRIWKVRQCARGLDLLEIKPEGDCALVSLFGTTKYFEWAAAEDLAPYDAQRLAERREQMLGWYKVHKRSGRTQALKALREAEMADVSEWTDPWSSSEDESSESEADDTEEAETRKANEQALASMKVGLTPDWIVHAACKVFDLAKPTIETPLIKGLLDPCTNSHLKPNVPAEKCYDKKDDGLKMSNSWEGYHVLLNPPYEAQVQWRFINRAINEVEWERCPGVILVCRNSTDTSYFQRLLPFPRVHLRRTAVQFKDYNNTPIGFGICVFCIVSPTHCRQREMYQRFFDEFHSAGEFNIPVDAEFAKSQPFIDLTTRLHRTACEAYRDSWIACDVCDRWREIPFNDMLKARTASVWQCRDSFALGCRAPLTRREVQAFSVAKAEKDTVLVASKAEGKNGPPALYATEAQGAQRDDDANDDVEEDVEDERDDGTQDGDEDNTEPAREAEAKTAEFVGSGGILHGLGCPCNWEPCRERRAKENKILSKHFPGLRVEWERMRDELTNALTPFETERLLTIERNKAALASMLNVKKEETKLTAAKTIHASAAESAALRMLDIAKQKLRVKERNAERRQNKIDHLQSALAAAEKRMSDMMSEVREANQGAETALQVLQAIRSRSNQVQIEHDLASQTLERTKRRVDDGTRRATRQTEAIWLQAMARIVPPPT